MPVHSVPGLDNFNPRSHEGSDTGEILEITITITISIHAPTRGATGMTWEQYYRIQISIHAPTRGATKLYRLIQGIFGFQSTLPRGERLARLNKRLYRGIFQSTLPRGERQYGSKFFRVIIISIHAPTRGATGIYW